MASESEESELIEAKETIVPVKGTTAQEPQNLGGDSSPSIPVPTSSCILKEDVESLKPAQSESLSGDSFRM